MRINHSLIVATIVALVPVAAAADRTKPAAVENTKAAQETITAELIIQRHIAALGGEQLLRGGKSFTFTVSGEKMGHKFTKTVTQMRPNLMRVDITSDDGPASKGFDGTVAWMKKGSAAPEKMPAEDTKSMAAHAEFEEPLLDYAKKGTTVKLLGKNEVAGAPAYELEVTFKSGDVERHFLDVKSFLLVKRTFAGKDKDGKAVQTSVRFGDYKNIQGRMVNHSVTWDGDDGKAYKSTVSNVAFDKAVDKKIFAMPAK